MALSSRKLTTRSLELTVTDIKKLLDFADKMEYEGGFVEMIAYGIGDTGDSQLNDLLRKLGDALTDVEDRWRELNEVHDLTVYYDDDDEEDED